MFALSGRSVGQILQDFKTAYAEHKFTTCVYIYFKIRGLHYGRIKYRRGPFRADYINHTFYYFKGFFPISRSRQILTAVFFMFLYLFFYPSALLLFFSFFFFIWFFLFLFLFFLFTFLLFLFLLFSFFCSFFLFLLLFFLFFLFTFFLWYKQCCQMNKICKHFFFIIKNL